MAETTVKKLADIVGTPVEKLLSQMKDAGLPHGDASEVVSDEQKQQLLAHLRKSHGAADTEAKKITLKRKSTSTMGLAQMGKKLLLLLIGDHFAGIAMG